MRFFCNLFLVSLVSLFSFLGYSQQIGWYEQWDQLGIYVSSSEIDSEGNVYQAGNFKYNLSVNINEVDTILSATNWNDMFISKMDENGRWIWVKQFGSVGDGSINDLVSDLAGNIYFSGYFRRDVDFDPSESKFILKGSERSRLGFVCKLSRDGELIWVTKINNLDDHSEGVGLVVDEFQNVYCTGNYFAPYKIWSPNYYSNGYSDVFLMKFDIDGNEVWSKRFGGSMYDNAHNLAFLSDSQLVISGAYSNTVDFDPSDDTLIKVSQAENNAFLTVFSTEGDFIWVKTIDSPTNTVFRSLEIDKNHNIYTTTSFVDTLSLTVKGVNRKIIPLNGSRDVLILKIDQKGAVSWVNQLEGSGGASSFDSEVSIDGDFIVSIIFDEELCYQLNGDRVCNNSLGEDDVLFLWLNKDGEIVNQTKLEGSGVIKVYTFKVNKDNVLYASGLLDGEMKINSTSEITSHGNIFHVRINSIVTNLEDNQLFNHKSTFYPNPTQGITYLNNSLGKSVLWIYDSIGNLVSKVKYQNHLDLRGFSPGVYFIHLSNNQKIELLGKVIVE